METPETVGLVAVVMAGIEFGKLAINRLSKNGNGKADTASLERIERKVDGIAEDVTAVRERVARLEGGR